MTTETALVRRTVTCQGPADQLADLLRQTHAAGRLVTPPQRIARRCLDTRANVWEIRYQVLERPSMSRRFARLWARAGLPVYVLAAIAGLLLAGHILWLIAGDEISAGLLLIVKAVGVVLALMFLAWLFTGRKSSCPGVATHCPPRHHR